METAKVLVRGETSGVLKEMRAFEFVFCLILMYRVMKVTEHLCQTLQRKAIDIRAALNFVGHTKSLVQDMRDDGWNDFLVALTSFCEKHNIDMPDMTARYLDGTGRPCQQQNFFTNEHHCCIEVLLLGKSFYPQDFLQDDLLSLEVECAYYMKDIVENATFHNLDSIFDLCRQLVQTRKSEFFPMIYRLICLVLTLPVSTATTERAFSSMNIIKNKLRNKIEEEFLDDCIVLHIEKEFAGAVDNEVVIKDFEDLVPRRVKFS
ncbi:uncharacterized protein LOC126796927 [Argentina anserina]|uniref:uncharacterized protein LOC126796927 n=1 Tax=Argentina anserina TaxID=57926 RepID=UPI0021767CF7|nr:uncharacterized protein LOC126796927 [Potentilla anserina]